MLILDLREGWQGVPTFVGIKSVGGSKIPKYFGAHFPRTLVLFSTTIFAPVCGAGSPRLQQRVIPKSFFVICPLGSNWVLKPITERGPYQSPIALRVSRHSSGRFERPVLEPFALRISSSLSNPNVKTLPSWIRKSICE